MKYFEELKRSMEFLSSKQDTIFIGQAVEVPGTAMSNTLKNVPKKKLLELPVAEEMQMGMTLGISLLGKTPISIYPRWNFLLCAINQLVNHIDKFPQMAPNWQKENIIIRTSIGSERPLFPQHQHVGDFTSGISKMCSNIVIKKLEEPEDILPCYIEAYNAKKGSVYIIVEYGDYYNEK